MTTLSLIDKLELVKGLDNPEKFLKEKTAELQADLEAWVKSIAPNLELVKDREAWVKKFVMEALLMQSPKYFHDLGQRLEELRQIKSIIASNSGSKIENRLRSLEISKSTPIETLYKFQNSRTTAGRIQASCPFHKDKNPSFTIFRRENRFKCFSCGERGDALDFYQKIHNVDFNAALNALGR